MYPQTYGQLMAKSAVRQAPAMTKAALSPQLQMALLGAGGGAGAGMLGSWAAGKDEDDKPRMSPTLMALLGAALGGAGGYYMGKPSYTPQVPYSPLANNPHPTNPTPQPKPPVSVNPTAMPKRSPGKVDNSPLAAGQKPATAKKPETAKPAANPKPAAKPDGPTLGNPVTGKPVGK